MNYCLPLREIHMEPEAFNAEAAIAGGGYRGEARGGGGMSWRKVYLSEFLDDGSIDIQTGPFGTQLKASDYTPEGTPVINVRNIGYGDLRPEKLEFVPDQVVSRLSKHLIQTRDIVFGRKGAVDRHLFVSESEAGWMQGSDCIRLRVLTDAIHPAFLSFGLRLPSHKQWMITQCSNKATMASLNQEIIGRISVNLPDTATQVRIASILSAYDDLIENNRRRIQLLEQAARLLYRVWFVHLRFPGHEHATITDGVPEGWEKKPFSELATFLNGFAFRPSHLGDVGLPIVKIPELRDGPTEKTPRNPGENIPGKYLLNTGDILFSWSGTLLVNIWNHGRALLNQHLFKVIPVADNLRSVVFFAVTTPPNEFGGI